MEWERNGRACFTSMSSCTQRSTFKKKGDNREPKALSSMRDAKANGTLITTEVASESRTAV